MGHIKIPRIMNNNNKSNTQKILNKISAEFIFLENNRTPIHPNL